jgi:hypothetical protein
MRAGMDPDGHWNWDDVKRTVGGALNAFNEANGFDLQPHRRKWDGKKFERRNPSVKTKGELCQCTV